MAILTRANLGQRGIFLAMPQATDCCDIANSFPATAALKGRQKVILAHHARRGAWLLDAAVAPASEDAEKHVLLGYASLFRPTFWRRAGLRGFVGAQLAGRTSVIACRNRRYRAAKLRREASPPGGALLPVFASRVESRELIRLRSTFKRAGGGRDAAAHRAFERCRVVGADVVAGQPQAGQCGRRGRARQAGAA